jgi:ABC-type transport system involved in multi-copper enzyme maturation permease subunit
MHRALIRKEILENILSYRFPLFLVILVLLIPTSLYVNYLEYGRRVSDYHEQLRLADETLRSSRLIDVHFGSVPLKGFLPPAPLSVFAHGFGNSLPRYYEFQPGGAKEGESSVGDESVLSILGRLDFLFIIQMVVSLIVLLFASDLVAGEKELGTLRGMLSNSVARPTILLAKLVGGFIAVWLPFVIAFLLGMIILSAASSQVLSGALLPRVLLMFAGTSLFMLTYFALGLLASTSTARGRSALVVTLLIWIVLQLVVPNVSDMVASVVYPVRTETVVSLQKSMIVKTLEEERGKLLGREYERIFGRGTPLTSDPTPRPGLEEWNTIKNDADHRFAERKSEQLRQVTDAHRREKQVQRTIANSIALLSPGAAFTRLITDLCATGEVDKAKYLDAVATHQQTLEAALFSHISKTTLIFPGGGTASSSSINELVDLKTLPGFSVNEATVGDAVAGNWGSVLSIAFWLLAAFALSHVRFLGYDVR